MKKIKSVLILVTVIITGDLFSQSIVDANNDTIATYNASTGMLTNSSTNEIGTLETNGNVTNAINEVIGSISDGQFKEASGAVIGYFETSKVYDINNDLIAEIQSSGTQIIDGNGDVVYSSTAAVNEEVLASIYFFFLREE